MQHITSHYISHIGNIIKKTSLGIILYTGTPIMYTCTHYTMYLLLTYLLVFISHFVYAY